MVLYVVIQDGTPVNASPMNGMPGSGNTMVSLLSGPGSANGDSQPLPPLDPEDTTSGKKKSSKKKGQKSDKNQEKANKIISEAIAKAQAEGKVIPKVVDSENPDDGDLTEDDGKKKKPKKPRYVEKEFYL